MRGCNLCVCGTLLRLPLRKWRNAFDANLDAYMVAAKLGEDPSSLSKACSLSSASRNDLSAFFFLYLRQAACIKHAAHGIEPGQTLCSINHIFFHFMLNMELIYDLYSVQLSRMTLTIRRRNWEATHFKSSGMRAKASTSDIVSTVLVEMGRFEEEVGSRAHVRSSSPQKSPAFSSDELKKPVLPPFVVAVASFPRMMNSISSTGSPSRTM
ncbi:hypothetical protein CR513_22217, partial [Mucuna pruriens]